MVSSARKVPMVSLPPWLWIARLTLTSPAITDRSRPLPTTSSLTSMVCPMLTNPPPPVIRGLETPLSPSRVAPTAIKCTGWALRL